MRRNQRSATAANRARRERRETTALGALIEQSRRNMRLTQAQLATIMQLEAAVNISKWESGQGISWVHMDALLLALPTMSAVEFWTLAKAHIPRDVHRYELNRRKFDLITTRVLNKLARAHGTTTQQELNELINVILERYADHALAKGITKGRRGPAASGLPNKMHA
ncbi:MAG: hypothetical protein Q7U76_12520 [Nitrospirota bacterium]|nr:hypothetical protein [Nitrospirota bacterium]